MGPLIYKSPVLNNLAGLSGAAHPALPFTYDSSSSLKDMFPVIFYSILRAN